MGRPGKKAQRLNLDAGSLFDFLEKDEESSVATLPTEFDRLRPEASYRELVSLSHRKRFAQFFTPEPVAELMVDWVLQAHPSSVLDPSVGPGIFLRLIENRLSNLPLVGIDVDPVALSAARATLKGASTRLVSGDFLTWADDQTFSGAVANPPYLRHHDINYSFDIFTNIGKKNFVVLTKLTNIYVLFILEICRRLTPGGRAAVIVPGEWANANFGMALKKFLLEMGYLHTLIYFSNLSEQFEDALTTAAILLIEKSNTNIRKSFNSYYVQNSVPLDALRATILNGEVSPTGVTHRQLISTDVVGLEKWDKVLKDGLAEQQAGFVPLSSMAKSRRGIATGANEFFHITGADASNFRIERGNLKPCVGRSDQVKGLRFTDTDFDALEAQNGKAWLLSFSSIPTKSEQEYIKRGMELGLQNRFLLAGRKPWYSMERRPPSPIWAAVFGRTSLRFVHNEAGISNLTTFHCIYPTRSDPVFCRALVACLNSRVVQELAEHQRRVYGGGLVKFEPKDLLSIQVPDLLRSSPEVLIELAEAFGRLDTAVRELGIIPTTIQDELDKLVRQAALPMETVELF